MAADPNDYKIPKAKKKKKNLKYRQGGGAPPYGAGPPNSPGSRVFWAKKIVKWSKQHRPDYGHVLGNDL